MINSFNKEYFYTSSGIRIFYQSNFDPQDFDSRKPTLIFNYGLLCSHGHWQHQLPYLSKMGFNLLLHDYRGHFSSSGIEDIKSINFENICHDLHELLESLAITEYAMLGHSMGVNVTLEYSRIYPKDIKGSILISGTVFPPQDIMFDTNIMDIATPALKWFTSSFPQAFDTVWKNSYKNPVARFFVHRGGFNTNYIKDEYVQFYMKKISELPKELLLHLLDEMKEHNVINELEKISTPSLIIGGDKDKIIPNYLQKILEKHMPNSELYIVKDGSHVPQSDFPDYINPRIGQFLEKIFNLE